MTNVTLTAEQAQQIEEALSGWKEYDAWTNQQMWNNDDEKALVTIREARAQEQAEQEPVAYFLDVKAGFSSKPLYEQVSDEYKNDADVFPLYAAPQPVSQEYQDHLVNQSFDWAAMAAKHQFMEGYRIGLAEMREKCAKACEEIEQDRWNLYKGRPPYTGSESGRADPHEQGVSMGAGECVAAIRAIKFEGDTGFRPVSEMIAEHKQDPKKAAAIEKAKMRKAEQEPMAKLIEMSKENFERHWGKNDFADWIYSDIADLFSEYAAPVRTKDLTDDEIMKINVDTASIVPTCDRQFHFARAVIAADREKNNANNNT